MRIKIISDPSPMQFETKVNKFLEEKSDLIIHEKTVFSITITRPYLQIDRDGNFNEIGSSTFYEAIFYGEL